MKNPKTIIFAGTVAVCGLLLVTTAFAQSTTSYSFSRNLGAGASGSDVSQLQTFLQTQGYLTIPTGTTLGYFGSLTKAAVIAWQGEVGLPATGYFGPLSRAKISITHTPPISTTNTPKITNLFPMSTTTGATITLTGTGFTSTGNNINFGVFRAVSNLSSSNGTTLTFTVPQYGGAECAANVACPMWATLFKASAYLLTVQNANGTSNALTFTLN